MLAACGVPCMGNEGLGRDSAGTEQFAGSSANTTTVGKHCPPLTTAVTHMTATAGEKQEVKTVPAHHRCGKKFGFRLFSPSCFSTLWLSSLGDCEFILHQASSFLFGSGKFSFIRGLLLYCLFVFNFQK